MPEQSVREQLMSANPRVVSWDRLFTWDGVEMRLARGQVIDVTPGSRLEQAIGAEYLVPMGAVAPVAAEAVTPAAEPDEPAGDQPATGRKRPSATVSRGNAATVRGSTKGTGS
jgi:hypothetical protein